MIPEQAKLGITERRNQGWTWQSIANWIEEEFEVRVHRTSIQRCYDKQVWEQAAEEYDQLNDLDARVKIDQKAIGWHQQALLWKRLYNKAINSTNRNESIIDAIYNSALSFKAVPPIKYPKPKGKIRGDSAQIVVAPLTDTHIGEDIDYQQMAGLNSYSFKIFNIRLSGWASTVLKLVELRRASVPIDELIIPMLGDMISGDIHDELIKTNQDNVMGQMIRGASLIAQAVLYLAPHFEKVTIPCVVGNHGRMTRKPPMKDKYMDWDYLLYQFVAVFCANQKNVTFNIKTSYMDIFQVFDRNVLIMHGDAVAGAGSLSSIPKVITNLRSVLQYRKQLEPENAEANKHIVDPNILPTSFDSVMMGHFHRVDEIDIGTGHAIICGCMKGGDEFALQRLGVITKPQQIVTYWHPKYGYIGKETVYLNSFDTVDSLFTDVLPEVWAEKI